MNKENAVMPLAPPYALCLLDECGSTNDEAKKLFAARGETAHGTAVLARRQTQGRGRHGRTWHSAEGNLYASLILRPETLFSSWPQLSFVTAIALAEVLRDLLPPLISVRLKWPNDVLVDGKKIAGILLETAGNEDDAAGTVVVGVGVNLAVAPEQTAWPATCLVDYGLVPPAPEMFWGRLMAIFDPWLQRWQRQGFAPIRERWQALGPQAGDWIRVRLPQEELQGRYLEISEDGALLLALADQQVRRIIAGDVIQLAGSGV